MESEIGKVRLYGMRIVFFLTFVGLAPSAWQKIISPTETWEPFYGMAVSFWAALLIFAVLGFIYPIKMIPLLVLQIFNKCVWLLGVGLPLWQQGLLKRVAKDLAYANGIGVVLDIVVIPWGAWLKITFISQHGRKANKAIQCGHFGFLSVLGWLCHFSPKTPL